MEILVEKPQNNPPNQPCLYGRSVPDFFRRQKKIKSIFLQANMYISVLKMTLPPHCRVSPEKTVWGVVLMEVIDVAVAFVPMSSDVTCQRKKVRVHRELAVRS